MTWIILAGGVIVVGVLTYIALHYPFPDKENRP